jgi:hypothetical protein
LVLAVQQDQAVQQQLAAVLVQTQFLALLLLTEVVVVEHLVAPLRELLDWTEVQEEAVAEEIPAAVLLVLEIPHLLLHHREMMVLPVLLEVVGALVVAVLAVLELIRLL